MLVRLEHERAARPEGSLRIPGERLGMPSVDERDDGLPVDDLGRERRELLAAHVRRVGDHEVPAVARQVREEIVVNDVDREARALRVLPREREGVLGHVDRGHASTGMLVRERERHGTRTSADVEDAGRVGAVEQGEAALDDRLGLRAGNQRARVDVERETSKAPLAEDVLERLARRAACEERARVLELRKA